MGSDTTVLIEAMGIFSVLSVTKVYSTFKSNTIYTPLQRQSIFRVNELHKWDSV